MILKKLVPKEVAETKTPALAEFMAALCSVVGFFVYKFLLTELFEEGPIAAACAPFGVFALCLLFPGLKNQFVSPALRILCRVVAVMLGFYALTAVTTYPSGITSEADTALTLVRYLSVLALAAAVLSFWYPSFVIVVATTILSKKAIGEDLFEIRISHTDYLPVAEIGLLLGIACLLLSRGGRWTSGKAVRSLFDCDVKSATVIVFMIGVGAHFANYFYSAVQKIQLDGGALFWAQYNPTYILSVNAWIGGFYPLGFWPEIAVPVLELSVRSHVLLNYMILLAQLLAVVFIVRRVTMIGLTLFYDVTHVVIFIVSGIFFWKWIVLNLALVAAMRRLPAWVEARSVAAISVASVVFAPTVFGVVWLGWYDTRALVVSEAYAVTKSGDVARVPSNFFGTISVTAAQHRFGRTEPGHWPTVTWGTTQSVKFLEGAREDCTFKPDAPTRFSRSKQQVSELIQLAHRYAQQNTSPDGRYVYDLFPHHIWSNPQLFRDFSRVAVSNIDYYIYRTRSGCTSLGLTGPEFKEHRSDEFVIPIKDFLKIDG